MHEITKLDYSKIDDDIMDKLINSLYMFKKMNPTRDIYFNEKTIIKIINMGNMIKNKNE
tara:strand:- start:1005 stop:1181 length:177 start_codon:yes stop_codon:yes gene_type:complete